MNKIERNFTPRVKLCIMGYETKIEKIEKIQGREKEPNFDVPTIDIIRHGDTDYKELQKSGFKINLDDPNFKLDPEHLDLNEKGIQAVRETAEHLADKIDKDKEIVLFITSPQLRAISSMLIIEDVFSSRGINILNSGCGKDEDGKARGYKEFATGLGQLPLVDKEIGSEWLEFAMDHLKNHPEIVGRPPAEVHQLIAVAFGRELSEIYSRSHKEVADGFKRFLRHTINIKKYLRDSTKMDIEEKRLRIVCVTHEERLFDFAHDALNMKETVKKGQLMEIKPEGNLEKGGETQANVAIFDKEGNLETASDIKFTFSEKL